MASGIGIRRISSKLLKPSKFGYFAPETSQFPLAFLNDSSNFEPHQNGKSRTFILDSSSRHLYLHNSNSVSRVFGYNEIVHRKSFFSYSLMGISQQAGLDESISNSLSSSSSSSQESISENSEKQKKNEDVQKAESSTPFPSDPIHSSPSNESLSSGLSPKPVVDFPEANQPNDDEKLKFENSQETLPNTHEETHGTMDEVSPPKPPHTSFDQSQSNAMTKIKILNKEMSDLISHNKFTEAWRLFQSWTAIPENVPSVLSYNFALHAMMRNKESSSKVMALFNKMVESKLEPNQLTFNSLLRCAFTEKNSVLAEDVVQKMSKSTVAPPDADAYNMLITLCAVNRRLGASMAHLQTMLSKGFVPSQTTYNELLDACSRVRRTKDATVILKAMHEQSITPTPTSLGELLTTASDAEDPQCAILTLKFATQFRFRIDEGCLLLILNLAARTGYSNLAELAWSLLETQKKNQPLFPPFHLARIHSYSAAGDLVSSFRSVREMEENLSKIDTIKEYKTDIFCPFTHLRPLTLACSRGIGVLDMAYYKLAEMHNSGEVVSLSAVNCVIAGCSALRDYERSQQTFDEIKNTFGYSPDVRSYNALMDGYSKSGQAVVVEKLIREMKEKNVHPDSTSYSIHVHSLVMSHDAQKAVSVLEEMISAGHIPSRSLFIRVLKRSRRSHYHEGIEKTVKFMNRFGIRQESGSEGRKRGLIMQGINQSNLSFNSNSDMNYLRQGQPSKQSNMWTIQQQQQLQKELLDEQW